jgi:aminopeptidase N
MAICITLLLALFATANAFAQDHDWELQHYDIQHYRYSVELSDDTNEIQCTATIHLKWKQPAGEVRLDLVKQDRSGKGMVVSAVESNGNPLSFQHKNDQLIIAVNKVEAGSMLNLVIDYSGVPADGLIISENKYGDRTFFCDHWPNRAHQWLPCVDHPADKATVDFMVTAPDHYQVVGNGTQLEESWLSDNLKFTHWHSNVPLPMKVAVIGAARFAVQYSGAVNHIPVYAWVYPQNKEEGFTDFKHAVRVLDFFDSHVGNYPYGKLDNVQSKTRYGGMENAGAIFYAEKLIKGKDQLESLLAHEIAHQWFGNTVTEANWHHIWLSEGFATFMENYYLGYQFGNDSLQKVWKRDRSRALAYARKKTAPIVDTSVTEWIKLLNRNSYEKGGWVLHMLRRKIGDSRFWETIRQYYQQYEHSNALTQDFINVAEKVCEEDLELFFQQWVFTAGHPKLSVDWSFADSNNHIDITVHQKQKGEVFHFPLELGVVYPNGTTSRQVVNINEQTNTFSFPVREKPLSIVLDPDTWLFFEEVN